MSVRQFHLLLLTIMLAAIALLAWIDAPGEIDLPHRLQPPPPKPEPLSLATPPTERWIATPRQRTQPTNQPSNHAPAQPLPERWRSLPVQAAVHLPDPPALLNHLRLSAPGQVRNRLAPGDRSRLFSLFCRAFGEAPANLDFLGFDALLAQAETTHSAAFLAMTRQALRAELDRRGEPLPDDWEKLENSPRGTLVWWLALEFPPGTQAPAPAGAFQLEPAPPAAAVGSPVPAGRAYSVTLGSLTLHALTRDNLMLIGPSLRVLTLAREAFDQPLPATAPPPPAPVPDEKPASGDAAPAATDLAEIRRDFDLFRQALAQPPAADTQVPDIHAFADGHLLAVATENAIPENWQSVTQIKRFEQLQCTATLRPNGVEWNVTVQVPQRSIYDFIALDGPRRLDRYFQADSFGLASLRLNWSSMVNYAGQLASRGYFGGKAQQSAMFAVPMLTMSNLPDGLGNELSVSLAPSQDKTYLAWSFAVPWRAPHSVKEITNITGLAGAPFDGPRSYRDESIYLPQFKAKMEFRYPILVEAPGGYDLPVRQPPAAGAAAPNDNVLLIAANGWNLDDVINLKQGKVKTLAQSNEFQQRMQAHAGQAAVQIYANLNHGFGYAYVTLLSELYGLPIDGSPLEESLLPRSECFGPLGHLWISLSREKLPDPPAPAAAKSSRLRFRIVWIMD